MLQEASDGVNKGKDDKLMASAGSRAHTEGNFRRGISLIPSRIDCLWITALSCPLPPVTRDLQGTSSGSLSLVWQPRRNMVSSFQLKHHPGLQPRIPNRDEDIRHT
ncbi:hypothetical protein Rs2_45671 [Raphanus sativus]|nr:hypothetical protein Rs2_45671 [Raphanus sativus]